MLHEPSQDAECHMMDAMLSRRFRCLAEGWESDLGEILAVNSGALTADEEWMLRTADLGGTVNLGGGACGITTVERIG